MAAGNDFDTPPEGGQQTPDYVKTLHTLRTDGSAGAATHFKTMMWKNTLQKSRGPASCLVETLLPVLFVVGLVGIWGSVAQGTVPTTQYVSNTTPSFNTANLTTMLQFTCAHSNFSGINGIPPCSPAEEANRSALFCYKGLPVKGLCTRIPGMAIVSQFLDWRKARYVPTFDEMVLMQWIANATVPEGLRKQYLSTFAGLTNVGALHFIPAQPHVYAFINYLNTTTRFFRYVTGRVFNDLQVAESFTSSAAQAGFTWGIVEIPIMSATVTQGMSLTIHLNRSGVPWTNTIREIAANGIGGHVTAKYLSCGFLTLQRTVSEYYMSTILNITTAPAPVYIPMPFLAYDTSAFLSIVGALAPLFLVFGYLYPVSQLVKRIVEEKEQRVREAMMIMGLGTGSFYISWVLTYFILQFFTALICAILLKATMMPKSDFFLIFVLFLLFGLSNIALSGLISAFFSKSRIAALVSPVVFFVFSIPSFALPATTPGGVFAFLSLLSPTAFAVGLRLMLDFEIGGGASWDRMVEATDNGYPLVLAFIMLAIDIVLYFVLTLYFDAILPSEWGTREHPCFCFVAPYRWWKRRSQKEQPEYIDGRDPHGAFEENLGRGRVPSVSMRGLRKEFVLPNGSTMVAVNNVTFDLYDNEVIALLGHNGAGKTTLINLMTGMLEPDGGDCTFHGHSVLTDMHGVRQEVGFCPQHNILWPELTCREHLMFFASLKGLTGDDQTNAVDAMIEAVGLKKLENNLSTELSGGQKRKLSVAIAFVGGSRVVFLDEPTAGMDVEARRHTWDLIKQMTPGRTIVLTTHYMDEADLLGNTVAIMSKGRLKCAGSSVFLKSRLGVGYTLTMATTGSGDLAVDAVCNAVPGAEVLNATAGEVAMRLPMASVPQFAPMLRILEDNHEALGLRGHGISVTTLEEIFLKIGHDDEVETNSEPDATAVSVNEVEAQKPQMLWNDELAKAEGTFMSQFEALFIKRFHNAKRDTRTIVMQIVLPVVCILIAMAMSAIKFPEAPRLAFSSAMYGSTVDVAIANAPATFLNYVSPGMTKIAAPGVTNATGMSTYLLDNFKNHPVHRTFSYVYNDQHFSPPTSTIFTNETGYSHSGPHALGEYYTNYMRHALGTNALVTEFATHPLKLSDQEQAFVSSITTIIVGIFIMIPFTFIPSTFVSFVVKEREMRAKHLQSVSGMNYFTYWLANFCFDIVSFFITAILAIIIFAVFSRNEYIGTGELFGAILLLMMMYGISGVVGSYVVSFAFDSHATAQNIVMLGNFICGFMLVLLAFILTLIPTTKSAGEALRYIFRIVPAYCLGEGIINMASLDLKKAFGDSSVSVWDLDVIGWDLIYLAIVFPLFTAITMYLDSPLRKSQQHQLLSEDSDGIDVVENEDADVAEERQIVESGQRDHDLVVVKNLRKKYHVHTRDIIAVRNLSFSVRKGEVFGFLGTNGAGKTTTISILCGEHLPTRGKGFIAGRDVVDEAGEARKLIGYCPQFDALNELLTADEHLNLYCGLRGITGQLRTDLVERLILLCGLTEHRGKESRSLSGGNKRKLSVAIALIGAPAVVFLDEPSAGMDPMARRGLWNVIEQVAQHCSVVLTTHHLEEVEALASRMGIMVDGELKCLGPLQHLKSKFGSGFEMAMRVSHAEDIATVTSFIASAIPQAVLQEEQGTKLTYMLPSDAKLSIVFEMIQSNKESLRIQDYSVSQTSLESVFLRISETATAKEDDHHHK